VSACLSQSDYWLGIAAACVLLGALIVGLVITLIEQQRETRRLNERITWLVAHRSD